MEILASMVVLSISGFFAYIAYDLMRFTRRDDKK
ncbi:hypothetical protein SAJA_14090 [Salinisphaera japonica YTM-1]|uniref:Uncharacterized protein n=1 Tax=Salinisphaera japonica YTM-1 TaxID=1209778 RepID=A0A423PFQ8_9GAMM|nr:hypothetical protein SAJA_14090 [Salinisphaera japonica YTM-1]